MFRRFKNADDDPVANQLRDAAEPNVLHLDGKPAKPAKSGKSGRKSLEWTAEDEPADLEPFEDEFDDSDEEDDRTPEQRRADLEAELQRQAEEFGLANLSPVSLYGPNGEAVASLLDSLAEIDDETAEAIADAHEAVPEPERKISRSFIRRRVRGWNLEAEVDTAEQAVNDWLSSLKLNYENEAVYATVADAARDAVDALVLEDELDDADFGTLYGPWSEVMDVEEDEAEDASGGTAKGAAGAARGEAEESAEEVGEFGPNTAIVVQFLARLTALQTPEIGELLTVWREQPKEELRTAHRNLQSLADEDAAWREQLRLAQEEVFAWMDGRATKYHEVPVGMDTSRVRESAGPAVADAVAALVMADMLEPEDAEALYAPWAEVIGEPALPAYEDEDGEDGDD
jgi:hypothetical protein